MVDNTFFELSSIVQSNLLSLSDTKTGVSLEEFGTIIDTVCNSLAKIPSTDESQNAIKQLEVNKPLGKLGPQRISELYTSLSKFIIQAASQNISSSQLKSKLKTFNWSSEKIDRLMKVFLVNQSKIQAVLRLYGTSPPKLVDVNWRLDYRLETNTRGPVHELMYIIELIMEDKGRRELLTFTASHAELEDLVNTLKDACHSVKRVALLKLGLQKKGNKLTHEVQ
ncbi:COMM domain-containing protein 3 isoform X1 [Daphnia magna]|uniref:COMM domain-containing protein 3 n=1 Tax=Daphnia magna TaxID=35525 RepID=A0ABR0AFQ2_9CRUS|nr:COMM domain-containing protein 3 isoform X1 [Daphnia magna]KAK4023942.1 hypothetical protein OUZ56_009334 [Daphnia magna]